jgi:hypothetical protein
MFTGYTELHREFQQFKCFALNRRWPSQDGQRIVRRDGSDDSIARQAGQVSQQGSEAVHWKTVRGDASGLLVDCLG